MPPQNCIYPERHLYTILCESYYWIRYVFEAISSRRPEQATDIHPGMVGSCPINFCASIKYSMQESFLQPWPFTKTISMCPFILFYKFCVAPNPSPGSHLVGAFVLHRMSLTLSPFLPRSLVKKSDFGRLAKDRTSSQIPIFYIHTCMWGPRREKERVLKIRKFVEK